jgi:hypothetical protein
VAAVLFQRAKRWATKICLHDLRGIRPSGILFLGCGFDLLPTYLFVEDSEPKFAIFCNIVVISALALLGELKTFREPSTCILGSIFSDQEKPVIR